ncbi:hypothetical protein BATDEDRAFT_86231 [Batrachochytrium dendrobatidis JAM81]|uniref:Tail specific protease domain-containing protein n=1 Tax=Batrachochytrium dendrobatidis (strain JAM81 / FGSC 10211) TaxID=684364 RepID=F4NW70_BATDJ|nr:uncharacterized protein BATDEDRAFT_86231 [Batrachochytrium dendrobatidis JAM81]EGF82426.1 hypothetical protein BATDEDRAFT_86231 [Batrachochytrium dendrobatidis JAM81]|eukprot:XP_006676921.1 hypothetical protein BATDEDRAFT_86231 [Batrachochytrium dendrobatidis JAM81]
MLVSSVVALLATAASVVSADLPKYSLIKTDRDAGRFTFVPTTRAQKEITLKNAENILTAWVNYDSKIANYGSAADPFPIMKSVRSNIDKISDEELQLTLNDAFVMIRDQHTRWFKPGPYRCFFATTGLKYNFIDADKDIVNKPKVVVSDIVKIPEFLALMGNEYSKIKLGDELLGINGKTFVEWFKENQFKSGDGANDFGGQRNALRYIGTIYGSVDRLPTVDSISLKFKSLSDNQEYTIAVPYVTSHSDVCWELSSTLYQRVANITLPGTPTGSSGFASFDIAEHERQRMIDAEDAIRNPVAVNAVYAEMANVEKELFGSVSASADTSSFKFIETDLKGISWGVYKPESKNMGVIKLDNFSPKLASTGTDASSVATSFVRRLLTHELKDTSSIVFELRGNPGGSILFANSLPQLFKPDFDSFGARYLKNNVTYNIFVKGKSARDTWVKVWNESPADARYTNIGPFNSFEAANSYGQVYTKPMGVFTDGNCFSACDLFSANIQGHEAGTVFGEDGLTGAGGANILDVDPALVIYSPTDFQRFPFSLELTNPATGSTYANMLSVGIRQSVRNGKYDGQLIEDTGIKSDIVVRANWSDLQPNSTTNTQYDRIADNLSRIGKTNGQADTMFVAEPFSIEANMGEFKLGAEVSGIEDITITSDDGKKVLATQKLTSDHHNVTISSKSIGSEIGTQRIAIIGSTKGKQIIKTYRIVRVVPTDEQRVHIATTPFTFNGTSSSVGLFNNAETAPGDGWNLNNGKWIVGNGTLYNNNVVTSLEVFMTAPVGTQVSLNLDVNLDCEKEFDYLGLLTKSDNKETPLITTTSRLTGRLIPGVSGKDAVVKGAYPFTTTTEKFSVILRFTSDRIGGAFKGATINSFTASAAK